MSPIGLYIKNLGVCTFVILRKISQSELTETLYI